MTETIEMTATTREIVGKANRRLDADRLAAVVYGTKHDATAVSLDRHAFELLASHGDGLGSKIIKLIVDENKPVNVIVKAIQHDPTKGYIRHVDLWAVNMSQTITTSVQLHFAGESPGVKNGGVMTHNVQSIQIECLPGDMPEYIEIDVSALEIGDAVHVSDLAVPKGVTILDSAEEIVAAVVPPAKEIDEESAAEAVEPEVIGASSDGE
ncbi:MAG: 50S ribosomal protein L25 [Coriobacteriia bacterium]|nr:50S ribosomal protein L25 [Coriobacteriia bacterium]